MQPPLALSSSHKKVLLPPHINPMLTFILNTLDVIRKTSFNVNKINYRLKVSFCSVLLKEALVKTQIISPLL